MNLSRFFTLEELTFSGTAQAENIPNQPTPTEVESLRALCTAVLDPLRESIGQPIKVNSGYRGPALNKRIKGATKSQHLVGQAADIQCPGMTVVDLFKTVIRMKLPYDQIIYEVKGPSKWVHVSHDPAGNKGEILLAQFAADGSVTYPRITADQALAMSEPGSRSIGGEPEPGYEEGADEPVRRATRGVAKAVAVKKAPAKKVVAKKAAVKKAPAKQAGKRSR